MTSLAWIEQSLCPRLAWTLAHFLWQGLLLGGLAALAAIALRRAAPSTRYALWTCSLALMAICPPLTFVFAPSADAPAAPSRSNVPITPSAAITPSSRAVAGGNSISSTARKPDGAIAESPIADSRPSVVAAERPSERRGLLAATWIVSAYLIGVVAFLVRGFMGAWGAQRLCRAAQPVSEPALLAAIARQSAALGLRATPAVVWCQRVAVPAVVGVWRPTILLPVSLATGLSPDQVEIILLHELAHLRRYDHLVHAAQRLIESLLFFHPAVWFVSSRMRIVREQCCDDLVLNAGITRHAYAELLIGVAEMGLQSGKTLPAGALAATSRPSALRERVLRILGIRDPSPLRLRGRELAIAGALFALLSIASLAAIDRSSVAQGGNSDKSAPPAALDEATRLRVRELLYVLRIHRISSRETEWAGAIRELIEIGKPATPEIIAELDRTSREVTLRSLCFTLRAINDPRSVPALVRAIPKTLCPSGSGYGVPIDDVELLKFMRQFDGSEGRSDPNYPTFSIKPPINELFSALETITRHREGPEQNDPLFDFQLGTLKSDSPEEHSAKLPAFIERQQAWQSWWNEHRAEFLSEEEEKSVELPPNEEDVVALAGEAKFGPLFPSGADVRLGPLREATLDLSRFADGKCAIDFDADRRFEMYEGDSSGLSGHVRRRAWVQEKGIDSVCHQLFNGPVLSGGDLHAWRIDDGRWDRIEDELQSGAPLELGAERQELVASYDAQGRASFFGTFLFTTRQGGCGILQTLDPGENAGAARFRYRMIKTGAAPEILEQSPPPAGAPFGPAVESVLAAPVAGAKCILDLESGSPIELPARFAKKDLFYLLPFREHRSFEQWFDDRRADVIVACDKDPRGESREKSNARNEKAPQRQSSNPIVGLYPRECFVVEVRPGAWDNATPSQLRTLVARSKEPGTPEGIVDGLGFIDGVSVPPGGGLPTYAIKTREGSIGLLQATEVRQKPNEIVFRYKLAPANAN